MPEEHHPPRFCFASPFQSAVCKHLRHAPGHLTHPPHACLKKPVVMVVVVVLVVMVLVVLLAVVTGFILTHKHEDVCLGFKSRRAGRTLLGHTQRHAHAHTHTHLC